MNNFVCRFTVRNIKYMTLCLAVLFSSGAFSAKDDKAREAYRQGDKITAYKEWTRLAENETEGGYSFDLGYRYFYGDDYPIDYEKAFFWFNKSAGMNSSEGQYMLGRMYYLGYGTSQNDKEAVFWFQKSMDNNYVEAIYWMGKMYSEGRGGLNKNDEKAFELYYRAAELNYGPAFYGLGMMYLDGRGVPQNHRDAVKMLKIASKDRVDAASVQLGIMYENGIGVEQDYVKAFEYYHNAKEDADAQYHIGSLLHANGNEDEKQGAVIYFAKAAEKGHIKAQTSLGLLLRDAGGAINNEDAIFWLRKAAQAGSADAQYGLGTLYKSGVVGVLQDDLQAHHWLEKAVKQDHAEAKFHLGKMYEGGIGVHRDETKAFDLFFSVARLGLSTAQFELGKLYYSSKQSKSMQKAYMWLNLARYNGYDVGDLLLSIAADMSVESINNAQKKSKECLRSDYKDCD